MVEELHILAFLEAGEAQGSEIVYRCILPTRQGSTRHAQADRR